MFSLGGTAGVDLNGELPRRLLLPRWVASYGVGIRVHPARNEMALGAALTVMASSRAREGRSGADSRALGIVAACAGVFFFDFLF